MQKSAAQSNGDTVATLHDGSRQIWYDPEVFSTFEPGLFDPVWLGGNDKIRDTSHGRNTAYFINHEGKDLVLRHYYRGGLIGRLNKDLFLRQPLAQTRPMAEYALLAWMNARGLPVPRPVAARMSPIGPCYRADILTLTIPESRTLADHLRSADLNADLWRLVGNTIAQMHAAGVMHSDLNCRNILIDQNEKFWLIDFDKCARRPAGKWSAGNLERLHRSFEKEHTKHPDFHWDEACWTALMTGYREAV